MCTRSPPASTGSTRRGPAWRIRLQFQPVPGGGRRTAVVSHGPRRMHALVAEAIARSCRWTGCATSPSRTSRPTNAVRSMTFLPSHRTRCRCAAGRRHGVRGRRGGSGGATTRGREILKLGQHEIRWYDTPHLPHAWECGLMLELNTRTLFCGDLFTRVAGRRLRHRVDILDRARPFAARWTITRMPRTRRQCSSGSPPIGRQCSPACTGSAWRGDGAALLRDLAQSLSGTDARRRDRLPLRDVVIRYRYSQLAPGRSRASLRRDQRRDSDGCATI